MFLFYTPEFLIYGYFCGDFQIYPSFIKFFQPRKLLRAMKKIFFLQIFLFSLISSFAQCPDLLQAMVNSCGTTEGNNEFIVFTTASSATAADYSLNYGSSNPPTVNNLAGSDATTKTGTGTVSTNGACAVVEITSSASSIPAGRRVIFIPASFDQNYDITGLCDGSNPIYVVYIKTNANGGLNSNWSSGGTMSNSATSPRYLQITYSGSATCDNTNAPVKTYTASGNWTNLSGTSADGNFVTWNGTTPSYSNNGCTAIILPLTLIDFSVYPARNERIIRWTTAHELNMYNYSLQQSTDGLHFQEIYTVNAKNAAGENQYQFSDKLSATGVVFYRVKMTENSGNFTYSKIIKSGSAAAPSIITRFYPNPAIDKLKIEFANNESGAVTYSITDILGKELMKGKSNAVAGYNELTLPLNALSTGQYILKIISGQNCMTRSFIKQ